MTDVRAPWSEEKRTRIRSTDPVFLEILEFHSEEVALLDHDEHLEWLEMLTDDISYRMPIRQTRYRFDGPGFDEETFHYKEDRLSLGLRARRNTQFQYAYDRDPPARLRRLVTNLLVYEGDTPDEYRATTNILVLKNRFDTPTYFFLSAERDDVIRRTPEGLKLAKRDIYVDMQVLSTRTFTNMFL